MSEEKVIKKQIICYTENDEKISVTYEGNSSMPFWNHDLKFEAAIALLSTVNEKDFANDDYYKYAKKVIECLNLPNFEDVSDQYFNGF